jgi:hypothetical protein
MVENIIFTLMNISNDDTMHKELLQNGYVDVVKKFVDLMVSSALQNNKDGVNEKEDGIDLKVMPAGSLRLMKAIAITLKNISENQECHSQCMQSGLLPLLRTSKQLHDYEVTANLFRTIGNFLTSPNQDIRRKCVHLGYLTDLLVNHENNKFFKIKRICSEYLN